MLGVYEVMSIKNNAKATVLLSTCVSETGFKEDIDCFAIPTCLTPLTPAKPPNIPVTLFKAKAIL